MAIRKIRTMGDRILNKVCRPVEEMTPKLRELVEDMLETMYDAYGVGLAAPQVGMLKRIVVIDVGDENGPYVLINPVIKETSGEQTGRRRMPFRTRKIRYRDKTERGNGRGAGYQHGTVYADRRGTSGACDLP